MTNIIKADLYRTKKSPSLYIVAGVSFLFVLLSAFVFKGLDAVFNTLASSDINLGIPDFSNEILGALGINTSFLCTKEILKSDTLFYVLIPIFIVVSSTEFTSGTLKNSLSAGISRKNVFFSKFATSCIYTVIYYAIFFVSAILCSCLAYWQPISFSEFAELMGIFVKQIPIYVGIIATGHFFVFATQSTALSIGLYIAPFTVVNTILPMLHALIDTKVNITLLFPLFQCIELTNTSISAINYATIYGSTLLYIIFSLWIGYSKFRKAELK